MVRGPRVPNPAQLHIDCGATWGHTDAIDGPEAQPSSSKEDGGGMIFAHIFGIPVEETALTFAPVILVACAGARAYGHQAHRRLRAGAQRRMRQGRSDAAKGSGSS